MTRARFGKVEPVTGDIGNQQAVEKLVSIMNNRNNELNKAANEALKDPQLRELMLSQGNEIGGGSPADFAALIKSEAAKWSAVVKAGNIKPEQVD